MFLLFLYGICSGCLAVSFRGCNSQNSLSKTDYFLQGNVALPRGLPTPENSQHKNVLFQRSQANFPCFVCTSLARIKPISGLSKNAWTASSNTTSSTTPSAAWRDVVFCLENTSFPRQNRHEKMYGSSQGQNFVGVFLEITIIQIFCPW